MPRVCKGVNAPIAAPGRRPPGTADRGDGWGRLEQNSEIVHRRDALPTPADAGGGCRRPMIRVTAGSAGAFGSIPTNPVRYPGPSGRPSRTRHGRRGSPLAGSRCHLTIIRCQLTMGARCQMTTPSSGPTPGSQGDA